MIRLLGCNLSNTKKISIALVAIYGIGISRAKTILNRLNINPNSKLPELNEKKIAKLRDFLESGEFKLEGELRKTIALNIKRLIEIGSFRGRRHLKGLPTRGQRTRTNHRTSRRLSVYRKFEKKKMPEKKVPIVTKKTIKKKKT